MQNVNNVYNTMIKVPHKSVYTLACLIKWQCKLIQKTAFQPTIRGNTSNIIWKQINCTEYSISVYSIPSYHSGII